MSEVLVSFDVTFDGLSEWEQQIAEAVALLPNEEEDLHTMDPADLERLYRQLYAITIAVEQVAAARLPVIREATERAYAAIRMYEVAEEKQRQSFNLARVA
jgi:hypothetical protein